MDTCGPKANSLFQLCCSMKWLRICSIEVTVSTLISNFFLDIIKGQAFKVFTQKHHQILGNSGLVDERELCVWSPPGLCSVSETWWTTGGDRSPALDKPPPPSPRMTRVVDRWVLTKCCWHAVPRLPLFVCVCAVLKILPIYRNLSATFVHLENGCAVCCHCLWVFSRTHKKKILIAKK